MKRPAPLSLLPDFREEAEARAQGYFCIVGIDEAGRGCLAGPVVAAAVLLSFGDYPKGVADSKALTEEEREAAYVHIVQKARAFAVGLASAEEIDKINILRATHLAMRRAFANLPPCILPDLALIDGLPVRPFAIDQIALVKGDTKCVSISAASIVAKVTRDRLMKGYAVQYPHYGFERHKGYGAPVHLRALETYGVCPLHRKTFRPVREVIEAWKERESG